MFSKNATTDFYFSVALHILLIQFFSMVFFVNCFLFYSFYNGEVLGVCLSYKCCPSLFETLSGTKLKRVHLCKQIKFISLNDKYLKFVAYSIEKGFQTIVFCFNNRGVNTE